MSVKFLQNTRPKELAMAASITVEEERGTYVRSPHHPHNGYYAGDFSGPPAPGIENDLRSTGLRAGSNASVRPA